MDLCICDNCNTVYPEDELVPLEQVSHLAERLDPGSIVPHGECPNCGAFAYKINLAVAAAGRVAGTRQCLYCRSKLTDLDPDVTLTTYKDKETMCRRVACKDCGRTWTDLFTLTEIKL